MGQFGCKNDKNGIEDYFKDIFQIVNSLNINSLIYAFRQPQWKKMDYEDQKSIIDINIIKQNCSIKSNIKWREFCHFRVRQTNKNHTPWLKYDPFAFQILDYSKRSSKHVNTISLDTEYIEQKQVINDPIFIVGCGRSGTTMLVKILSFCLQFICLHEPQLLWLSIFPQFNVWQPDNLYKASFNGDKINNLQNRIDQVKRKYQIILKETGGKIIVDKQPQNLFKIQMLLNCFPNSKIIVLKRSQKEVAKSISQFPQEQWYGKQCIKYNYLKQLAKDHGIDFSEQKQEMSMKKRGEIQWQISYKYYNQLINRLNINQRSQIHQIDYQSLLSKDHLHNCLMSVCDFLNISKQNRMKIIQGAKWLIKCRD